MAAAASPAMGMPPQTMPGNAWGAGAPNHQRAGTYGVPPGFANTQVFANPGAINTGRRQRVTNAFFPEIEATDLQRMFDDRVAQNDDFQYNGEKDGETWKRKVRGYLVSQCPDIAPFLGFAE